MVVHLAAGPCKLVCAAGHHREALCLESENEQRSSGNTHTTMPVVDIHAAFESVSSSSALPTLQAILLPRLPTVAPSTGCNDRLKANRSSAGKIMLT